MENNQIEIYRSVTETVYYNLDVIISVGYRVKSKQGVAFRRWANNVLKQYLIKGYVINQKRLDHYDDLKSVVNLMSCAITLQQKVTTGEYDGLFCIISDYVYALDTLDRDIFEVHSGLKPGKTEKSDFGSLTLELGIPAHVVRRRFIAA